MTVEPRGNTERSSLYERLGGWGCIAIIAELWCDRALADPSLAPHLVGADAAALRKEQTDFLVHSAGGPIRAPAQPLPPLYALVPPSPWHRERLLGHLIAALVFANVARDVIEQVLDTLSPPNPQARPPQPGADPNG